MSVFTQIAEFLTRESHSTFRSDVDFLFFSAVAPIRDKNGDVVDSSSSPNAMTRGLVKTGTWLVRFGEDPDLLVLQRMSFVTAKQTKGCNDWLFG